MKISRHQIIAFAAVGKEKSFSKAAQSLRLGQSAITQHISALESAIGVKLFTRSRAGAELTGIGHELFDLADRMRVLEEQFLERANQYADLQTGKLSVCVSTPRPAMAVISAYQQRYPGIKVELQVAPWHDALNLIQRREVDVAIIMQPESTDGLKITEVESQSFVAVLPQQHPLANKSKIHTDELKDETLIMLTETSYTRFWVNKKFAELNLSPSNTLTTTSYEMMLEAVIHGLGVSIALEGAFADYAQVCTVPIVEFSEQHAFVVVCAEDKAQLHTVRSFHEIVDAIILRKARISRKTTTTLLTA